MRRAGRGRAGGSERASAQCECVAEDLGGQRDIPHPLLASTWTRGITALTSSRRGVAQLARHCGGHFWWPTSPRGNDAAPELEVTEGGGACRLPAGGRYVLLFWSRPPKLQVITSSRHGQVGAFETPGAGTPAIPTSPVRVMQLTGTPHKVSLVHCSYTLLTRSPSPTCGHAGAGRSTASRHRAVFVPIRQPANQLIVATIITMASMLPRSRIAQCPRRK